jgi:UDP-2,3-diacylglucosamine hydrolase
MDKIKRIAVIAGSGKFPLFLLKAAQSNGVKTVTLAITGSADKSIQDLSDSIYWIEIGQGKKLIDILQKENITHAVMAGKINKTTIIRQAFMLDPEARSIIQNTKDRKDDTMLSAVADRLKDFNIQLIDSTLFLQDFMADKGHQTRIKPNRIQAQDIAFGYDIAKNMGSLDIGQSIIVKDKAVIAVEAIEGTDQAIIRAGSLVGKGTVIIKVSKPDQDMRFDVPTVGCETLDVMQKAGAAVLAVEAGKVLMLEKDEMIEKANNMRLCITGI